MSNQHISIRANKVLTEDNCDEFITYRNADITLKYVLTLNQYAIYCVSFLSFSFSKVSSRSKDAIYCF
jgi:hypothetical protein